MLVDGCCSGRSTALRRHTLISTSWDTGDVTRRAEDLGGDSERNAETPQHENRHGQTSMRSPTLVRPVFCRVLSSGILCDFAKRLNEAIPMSRRQKRYS